MLGLRRMVISTWNDAYPGSEKLDYGRYDRWIEPDPERRVIWRFAWDLLLTNRLHTGRNLRRTACARLPTAQRTPVCPDR